MLEVKYLETNIMFTFKSHPPMCSDPEKQNSHHFYFGCVTLDCCHPDSNLSEIWQLLGCALPHLAES